MPVRTRSPGPRLVGFALLALAALATGTAAVAAERAQGAGEEGEPRSATRADDRSDKVCRRVRPVGSNIPQTICRTRQQMAEEQAAARDALDNDRVRQD
jgi:hypothetical protein